MKNKRKNIIVPFKTKIQAAVYSIKNGQKAALKEFPFSRFAIRTWREIFTKGYFMFHPSWKQPYFGMKSLKTSKANRKRQNSENEMSSENSSLNLDMENIFWEVGQSSDKKYTNIFLKQIQAAIFAVQYGIEEANMKFKKFKKDEIILFKYHFFQDGYYELHNQVTDEELEKVAKDIKHKKEIVVKKTKGVKITPSEKLEIVRTYLSLQKYQSIKEVANSARIGLQTLNEWVFHYKKHGERAEVFNNLTPRYGTRFNIRERLEIVKEAARTCYGDAAAKYQISRSSIGGWKYTYFKGIKDQKDILNFCLTDEEIKDLEKLECQRYLNRGRHGRRTSININILKGLGASKIETIKSNNDIETICEENNSNSLHQLSNNSIIYRKNNLNINTEKSIITKQLPSISHGNGVKESYNNNNNNMEGDLSPKMKSKIVKKALLIGPKTLEEISTEFGIDLPVLITMIPFTFI